MNSRNPAVKRWRPIKQLLVTGGICRKAADARFGYRSFLFRKPLAFAAFRGPQRPPTFAS
jgi:hypothetical protein